MAFTFTDLLAQLTNDLSLIVDGRWYELDEADTIKIERSKWLLVFQIGGVVLLVGATVAVATFATKIGPAATILTPILPALAVGLLSSAGLSTSVIDRYIQTGSKIVPSK